MQYEYFHMDILEDPEFYIEDPDNDPVDRLDPKSDDEAIVD